MQCTALHCSELPDGRQDGRHADGGRQGTALHCKSPQIGFVRITCSNSLDELPLRVHFCVPCRRLGLFHQLQLAMQLQHLNTDLHKSDLSQGGRGTLAQRRGIWYEGDRMRWSPHPCKLDCWIQIGFDHNTSTLMKCMALQAAALQVSASSGWIARNWAPTWRRDGGGIDLELGLAVVAEDGNYVPNLVGHDGHPSCLSERSLELRRRPPAAADAALHQAWLQQDGARASKSRWIQFSESHLEKSDRTQIHWSPLSLHKLHFEPLRFHF